MKLTEWHKREVRRDPEYALAALRVCNAEIGRLQAALLEIQNLELRVTVPIDSPEAKDANDAIWKWMKAIRKITDRALLQEETT